MAAFGCPRGTTETAAVARYPLAGDFRESPGGRPSPEISAFQATPIESLRSISGQEPSRSAGVGKTWLSSTLCADLPLHVYTAFTRSPAVSARQWERRPGVQIDRLARDFADGVVLLRVEAAGGKCKGRLGLCEAGCMVDEVGLRMFVPPQVADLPGPRRTKGGSRPSPDREKTMPGPGLLDTVADGSGILKSQSAPFRSVPWFSGGTQAAPEPCAA